MAGSIGSILFLVQMAEESRLVTDLRFAQAVGPESAAPVALHSRTEFIMLKSLQSRGAIIQTEPGVFWLNETAYGAVVRGRLFRFAAIFIGVTVVAGFFAFLQVTGRA